MEKKLTCNLHLHIGTDTKEVFDHTTARNGVYWVNHINLNLFCITYRFYIYLQGTMGAHNYTWHVFFTLVLILYNHVNSWLTETCFCNTKNPLRPTNRGLLFYNHAVADLTGCYRRPLPSPFISITCRFLEMAKIIGWPPHLWDWRPPPHWEILDPPLSCIDSLTIAFPDVIDRTNSQNASCRYLIYNLLPCLWVMSLSN